MSDPLPGFAWSTLYCRYDKACKRFNPRSTHLAAVQPPVAKDRELYYWLVQTAHSGSGKRPSLGVGWYEALLYWKLYSSTPGGTLANWLSGLAAQDLAQLLGALPATLPQSVVAIESALDLIGRYKLPGMASADALPVRTTFLHCLYPAIVPIFDKMVLKAAGAWTPGANKSRAVLRRYLPHAWTLAARYSPKLQNFNESAVRLVDMALWVIR